MTLLLLLALFGCDRTPPPLDRDTEVVVPVDPVDTGDTSDDPVVTEPDAPLIILISMDGFRHDYLARADTPHLDRLAAEGVRAEALIPAFPANTFPNHYTIATGLYPANHGLIDNTFYAPDQSGSFSMSDPDHQTDPRWWGGEPLWITVERNDLAAGTVFWVGSEVEWHHGVEQSFKLPYSGFVSFAQRVDHLLGWLDEPDRPVFATLYFNQPDSVGHSHGPDSADVDAMVTVVDAAIGRLIAGLESRDLYDHTHLVVVSDHGMTPLSEERVTYLDDHIDLSSVWVHRWGAWASIWPRSWTDESALQASLAEVPNASCAARADLPAHLHFSEGERVPPYVCVADLGWSIDRRGWDSEYIGGHGFDPSHSDMHGVFLARGPGLRVGEVVPAFESVHVHALVTHLLELEGPEVDARFEVVAPLLED